MTLTLDEETSTAYLVGRTERRYAWEATAIEQRIEDELYYSEVMEPVMVLMSDGTVAFYVAGGLVI